MNFEKYDCMLIYQIPTPPVEAGYPALLLAALCALLLGGFVYGLKRIDKMYSDQLDFLRAEKKQRDEDDKVQRAEMAAKWDEADKRREERAAHLITEVRESTADISAAVAKHDEQLHDIAKSQAKALGDIAQSLKILSSKGS